MQLADGSSGTARSSRKTSASLPDLTMPGSVSNAPALVTSQSGRGSGPRPVGVVPGQVVQRWPSPGSRPAKVGMSKETVGKKSSDNTVVAPKDSGRPAIGLRSAASGP